MPPMYQWHCDTCKQTVEVIRSFAEYDNPPAEDELDSGKKEASTCTGHVWRRVIGGNQSLMRGPGWKGAKGYW